jgi:hypothetical protein
MCSYEIVEYSVHRNCIATPSAISHHLVPSFASEADPLGFGCIWPGPWAPRGRTTSDDDDDDDDDDGPQSKCNLQVDKPTRLGKLDHLTATADSYISSRLETAPSYCTPIMSGWMSYFTGKPKDSRQSARDSIVGLRSQLLVLDKREEFLQKKIEEELKKAKTNATANKRCEYYCYSRNRPGLSDCVCSDTPC